MTQNEAAPHRFLTVVTKNIFFGIERMSWRVFFSFFRISIGKMVQTRKTLEK